YALNLLERARSAAETGTALGDPKAIEAVLNLVVIKGPGQSAGVLGSWKGLYLGGLFLPPQIAVNTESKDEFKVSKDVRLTPDKIGVILHTSMHPYDLLIHPVGERIVVMEVGKGLPDNYET